MSKGSINDFYCVVCGNKGISVPRKNGKQREAGHLKKLYCIYCRKETNHAEVKSFGSSYTKEDFDLEFSTGRFVNQHKIPIKDLPGCKNEDCFCCVNGKCWNSIGDVRAICGYSREEKEKEKIPDIVYCADGTIKEEYR